MSGTLTLINQREGGMRLEPIGRVANPHERKKEPLIVPIVGYDIDDNEVITEIRFLPEVPSGATIDMLRATDNDGNIKSAAAIDYVDACVSPDDIEKWDELLHGKDIIISTATLLLVYREIAEFYADRPTKRSSGSLAGRSRTKTTTSRDVGKPVSKSRKSA